MVLTGIEAAGGLGAYMSPSPVNNKTEKGESQERAVLLTTSDFAYGRVVAENNAQQLQMHETIEERRKEAATEERNAARRAALEEAAKQTQNMRGDESTEGKDLSMIRVETSGSVVASMDDAISSENEHGIGFEPEARSDASEKDAALIQHVDVLA